MRCSAFSHVDKTQKQTHTTRDTIILDAFHDYKPTLNQDKQKQQDKRLRLHPPKPPKGGSQSASRPAPEAPSARRLGEGPTDSSPGGFGVRAPLEKEPTGRAGRGGGFQKVREGEYLRVPPIKIKLSDLGIWRSEPLCQCGFFACQLIIIFISNKCRKTIRTASNIVLRAQKMKTY